MVLDSSAGPRTFPAEDAITPVPIDQQLVNQPAAGTLNVCRQYFVRQFNQEAIGGSQTGKYCWIRFEGLIDRCRTAIKA